MDLDTWLALPEDAAGELVDGKLTEEEKPDPVHELAVSWMIALLRTWLQGQGFVFGSEVKFIVSAARGRKPDLSVYLPGGAIPPRRGALRVPPDILVEVVTPSPTDERRDRVEKMDEYAAFGVRYYWLLDPALGSLEIFELEGKRFVRALAATSGALRAIPGCTGLSLDLDALWAELARLAEADQP